MAINKVVYGNNTLIDLTGDTVTPEKLLQGETAHNAAGEQIIGTVSGGGIFYGTCTGEEANQIKAVTVSNEQNFELKAGLILAVKFDANNTYSATTENPVKLNVNNTGAKQIYGGNTATPTGTNTTYFGRLNYYNYYVYDGTYWVWAGSSADNNTTYTPQGLGFGYAICSTAAATTAKVATLSGYSLVTNGIVSVKFTNSVPANATLNINNKGAKNIYYQGAKIVAGVIKAGDIATFVYSGNYNLICIDRGSNGHIIVDSSGSQLASENSLQFADSHVTDDETNGRTIVENIKEHTTASDYENATEDGIHVIDDGNDVPIGASSEDKVEVVADGNTTWGTLFDSLFNDEHFDVTKVTKNALLVIDNNVLQISWNETTELDFYSVPTINASNVVMLYARLQSSGSTYFSATNGTPSSKTSQNAPQGSKITLYYGTSSTVINLKTDANYCQYDSQTTVKQKIDGLTVGKVNQVYTDWDYSLSFKARGGNGHALLFDWQAVMAVLYNDNGVISILDIIGSGASHFTSSISGGIITITRDAPHTLTLFY